jgi:MSHA biogenesis protein MshL
MNRKGPVAVASGVRWLAQPALVVLLLAGCQAPVRHKTVNTDLMDDIQAELVSSAASSQRKVNPDAPPLEVLQALVPGLNLGAAAMKPVEERFDFAVRQPLDVKEFFPLLFEGTEYSVIVHPGLSGSIAALDLKNVTIDEAMQQLSAIYGFYIHREGSIYRVEPGGLQTRIFQVNYLDVQRNGTSNMSVTGGNTLGSGSGLGGGLGGYGGVGGYGGINSGIGGIGGIGGLGGMGGVNGINNGLVGLGGIGGVGGNGGGGASVNTRSTSDFWSELKDAISSIINTGAGSSSLSGLLGGSSDNGGREVIISAQTGMVVVRAYPAELDKVAEFLSRSEAALQRQVVLEAKILEVTLNENFQSGINLALLDTVNNGNVIRARTSFPGGLDTPTGGGQLPGDVLTDPLDELLRRNSQSGAIGYLGNDFGAVIRLLEAQGSVQVISSPRITTLNNQKAVFKVGDEEYFATNPTTGVTTGTAATTTAQNANLQPFFSGISLDVTPQISDTGDIILHIHPLLNTVLQDSKSIGGETYPLAKSDTRESDSIARARNGEVIVISGLMQTRAKGSEAGIPGARNVPVLGNAFEQRATELEKTELVILLRAVVDEGSNMRDMIREHEDSFDALRRRTDPYYR